MIGFIEGQISSRDILRSLSIVYIGNLIGSLFLVLLMYYSEQWTLNSHMVGAKALLIANNKVNLAFHTAFVRGILCNFLVCLAVWLCFGARTTTDKIIAVIFPITAFVASGFEHCVANMYFIPMGMSLKSNALVLTAAEVMQDSPLLLDNLTLSGFIVKNLIPVTLGNILGGSVLVGIVYWSVYLREFSFRSLFRLIQVVFQMVFFIHPRELSPSRIGNTLQIFFSILSRKRVSRRPLPRDLTNIIKKDKNEP